MLPEFSYVRPGSLKDAIEVLTGDGTRAHAGGTDLLGCLHDGAMSASTVVSLSDLDELRGIRENADGGLAIGTLTTISEVSQSELVTEHYPGLAQAAGEVASPQLRNQGTIGGNLCQRPRCWYFRGEFHCAKKGGDVCYAVEGENRYHAIFGGDPCYIVHPSDTAPMLLALGASVKIVGPDGGRTVKLDDFFVLPGDELYKENVLGSGEIVAEVVLPSPASGLTSSYRKIRERGAWDFALVSVALALQMSGTRVLAGRVVFGGVAPMPWRSEAVEAAIVGKEIGPEMAATAAAAAVAGAQPLEQNGYKVPLLKAAVAESLLGVVG
ncbi:MAG: xanthine dehydrogenase family protein subunit M [Deltaproteobacteria bacterium]|nr:xanthine dehydrogenase family protein subunit M [Deltaproteobacteria bacterium]